MSVHVHQRLGPRPAHAHTRLQQAALLFVEGVPRHHALHGAVQVAQRIKARHHRRGCGFIHPVLQRNAQGPKPVIARVNGFALGGGLELAMACHLRIAADTAKVGQPEINLGLIPGFGGSQRLLRLCGRAATLELCLLGAPINAARALELGIVNEVVPADALDNRVQDIARQLARSAPLALRGLLDAVHVGGECSLEAGLEYESAQFGLLFATEDMREGTSAFLQRRPPAFQNR